MILSLNALYIAGIAVGITGVGGVVMALMSVGCFRLNGQVEATIAYPLTFDECAVALPYCRSGALVMPTVLCCCLCTEIGSSTGIAASVVLSAMTVIVLSVLTNVENGLGVMAKAPNYQIQLGELLRSSSTPATVSVVSGLHAGLVGTGGVEIKRAWTAAVVGMTSGAADANSFRVLPELTICVGALRVLTGLFALTKVDPQLARAT
jgi:hypothetical protein